MFNPCSCLGAKQDEPYCMCVMIDNGLKTKEDYVYTKEEKDNLSNVLSKTFGWNIVKTFKLDKQ